MNEDTIAGKLKEAGGSLERKVGEAIGNDRMANSGTVTEVKGGAQETWGKTKDAAADVVAPASKDASDTGSEVRSGISGAAQHAKDAVEHGVDKLKSGMKGEEEEVRQVH